MRFLKKDFLMQIRIAIGSKGTENLFVSLPIYVLFLFLFSCSKKEEKIPADVIPKNKMVQIMVDVHLAEAQLQLKAPFDNSKSLKQSYYRFIFNKHKTSFDQMTKSWKFYAAHPDIFSEIYDEVITELSKKQAETSGKSK